MGDQTRAAKLWIALLAAVCLCGCARSGSTAEQSRPADSGKETPSMYLRSPAFPSDPSTSGATGSTIPAKYAMRTVPGGSNVSIPYAWSDAPATTKSFVLVLSDAAPMAHDWVHWAVADIPASSAGLPEGASGTDAMPPGAREFGNTFGFAGYGGPQPPVGSGAHPYVATLYALDVAHLALPQAPTAAQLERACASHALARATCVGRFGR